MKGHKLPRCPKIGRPPEGHVGRPKDIKSHPPSVPRHRSLLGRPQTGAPPITHIFFLQVVYSAARLDCRPLIPRTRSMEVHAQALKRSPPVANLPRWLRWRNKYEISLQTFRNSLDRTRSLTRSSCNKRLRSRRQGTRERVRKGGMLSLDKNNKKNNNKNNNRSNNTSNAKSRRVRRRANNTRITVEESSAKWEQELKAMRIQMGEMKDEFKGRTAKNLDDLVHTTDSPFTKSLTEQTTKVVLTAFISGLQAGDFLFSVYKDPPSTMTEMMYEAQRHMNGEEALLARDQTVGKKRKWEHPDRPAEPHDTRPKAQRNRNRRTRG
uniref:Uncharacterized protein n=1 Tax=Fagus sylvatica TaxID=28930 RepID=A0A2N9H5K9_FAGSY